MNETKIVPLNGKLPRGAIAQLSRKYSIPHSTVSNIASGVIENAELYEEMLTMAIEEKKRRDKLAELIRKAKEEDL